MLVTSHLNQDCKECSSLGALVEEINCYLAKEGQVLIDNSKYGMNHKIADIKDIVRFKNIIVTRTFNPSYLNYIDIKDIINQVKQLINV